jgi:hypothetical protein
MDDIRHVLVTTQYRGVYYGRLVAHDPVARQCILTDAHMAIYWGTTDGVDQLAARGPTATSKLGARALRIWIPGLHGPPRLLADGGGGHR